MLLDKFILYLVQQSHNFSSTKYVWAAVEANKSTHTTEVRAIAYILPRGPQNFIPEIEVKKIRKDFPAHKSLPDTSRAKCDNKFSLQNVTRNCHNKS